MGTKDLRMSMSLTMPVSECLGRYLAARDKAASLLLEAQCLGDHEKYILAIDALEMSFLFRMCLSTTATPTNETLMQMVVFTADWDNPEQEEGCATPPPSDA